MRISVFSLFRDSEDYIYDCLKKWDMIEKNTNADFEYFFYENDSTDSTANILSNWFKNKKGQLKSEILNTKKFGSVINQERMILLSNARNKMIDLDQNKDSDYSIVFDSDVSFNDQIVNDFLKFKNLDFSMLTANTRQNVPCKMGSGSPDSYYDSSILFDMDGFNCMTWSDNPFYEKKDRINYENGDPIQVSRAFGSFSFLKTKYLKHCNWKSQGESEHWSWCDQLTRLSPIYVIPTIKPTVNIDQKKWPHENKVIEHQTKMLKNKWNRFLWKNNSKALL